MTLTLIPPGEFMMGSPKSEAGRDPRREHLHRVTLTRPFGMGMHEVTQEQYEQVMGKNPSKRKGEQHPAEAMTWREAIEYCRKLSALPKEKASARVYRLPTEAEWEYVCRAGTTTAYSFGDDASKLGEYAWYVGNSGKKSHPIGEKNPNPWGVCGMHGNVFEWCHDWFGAYPSGSVINPMGPTTGKDKLNRGGSFNNTSEVSRSAERGGFSPSGGHGVLGFRVVLEIPVRAQPKTSAAETKALPANLQEGLIAYYPFNGNANDESGNGNDGTVLGAKVIQDRFGQLERAYDFDGRDDQIMVRAMHWPHGKSPRTVVAWFKSSADKPGNIVSFGDGKKTGRRFSLRLMPGKLNFIGENRDATFPLSPKPSPQTWGQYAVVYDGSIVACYWQGQAKRVFPMNLDTDGRFPLVIGSNTINRRDEFFKGAIDDVRVYNRALSAAEVKALYEYEKP